MKRKKKQSTINELRDWASATLSRANYDLREADTLLAHVLGRSETYLISHSEKIVCTAVKKKFQTLVKERIKGVPIAYLKNTKGFFGLDFFVDERVLIPRPETEILIEWILKHTNREKKITIADVGTGSGCIAVTLARYLPKAKIFAIDTSTKALTVAKKNATTHKVKSRISFKKGSLLKPLEKIDVDLVIANLPYLEKHELGNVPFEPVEALYGGNKGLEDIDKIIDQTIDQKINQTILEIHPLQEAWLDMRLRHIHSVSSYFIKDYSEKVRALVIEKNAQSLDDHALKSL